jgi:hypothetical protein
MQTTGIYEKDTEEMFSTMGEKRAVTTGAGRRGLVLFIMTVGYFLVLLDVTIINVTLPSIRGAIGVGVSGLQMGGRRLRGGAGQPAAGGRHTR